MLEVAATSSKPNSNLIKTILEIAVTSSKFDSNLINTACQKQWRPVQSLSRTSYKPEWLQSEPYGFQLEMKLTNGRRAVLRWPPLSEITATTIIMGSTSAIVTY